MPNFDIILMLTILAITMVLFVSEKLRPDVAALALFLTFAAFMNAFGMVVPAHAPEAWLGAVLGTTSAPVVVGTLFLAGVILIPSVLVGATARLSALLSASGRTVVEEATRYAYALVPLGFGMWVAHYLYLFLIGGMSIIPATQEYMADLGLPFLGSATWTHGPMVPDSWLLPLEIFFLELGLLASLVVAFRIAQRELGPGRRALRGALPWGALAIILSALGIWVLLQPMEM